MTTDKKKQHYVPVFYLKNFSIELNKKEIGIFNTKSQEYIKAGPLKNQGYKKFFYGRDGVMEDWLSKIEGDLTKCIRTILTTKMIPVKNSLDHVDLIAFVAITDIRNPISIGLISERNEIMKASILEIDPSADTTELIPDTTHEENVELSFSNVKLIVKICGDLDFKLIINKTETPFITSDVPVVRYNQFLERNNWQYGKAGFGNIGLQIFIPLSPSISIIFYDPKIYNIGNKRHHYLDITREDDIDQLNLLQILNCKNNLFFNEGISENYISELFIVSKQFKKANQAVSSIHDLHEEGSNGSRLLRMGTTECEIDLNIKGMTVNSGASKVKFTDSVTMFRSHVQRIRDLEKNYE
ncbi:hypothetical protein D3C87_40040 [compost metagenome]